MIEDGLVAGYIYYVLEDAKGLMGDLYVMREHRTLDRENALLAAALRAIVAHPQVTRIESQLMMLDFASHRIVPGSANLTSFDRNFMRIDLQRAPLPESRIRRAVTIDRWTDLHQEATAHLISSAYQSHVDSRINDQYRTIAGARRFLHNIVQYPGCGTFYRPASFSAFEPSRGTLAGISLASLVSPECGHITQICVSPEIKGSGAGYALLRHSLLALREMGCHAATLTVTAANEGAVELYRRSASGRCDVSRRTCGKASAFRRRRAALPPTDLCARPPSGVRRFRTAPCLNEIYRNRRAMSGRAPSLLL
ncbi:MAG: GNAT family N-acetyltransferase [Ignavibacteriota bacterium]